MTAKMTLGSGTSSGTHLGRAIIPAIVGSAAAGIAWWALADLPEGSRSGFRGFGWFIQSLDLLVITTSIPNVVGVSLLSRRLSPYHGASVVATTAFVLLVGLAYGVVILVAGIIVGLALFLMPMLLTVPKQALPRNSRFESGPP
jgi:hypothetical protein